MQFARGLSSQARDVLDSNMTAYFNGRLDNHNLYPADKRWVVAG
jgi:hypothetical protein